MNKAAKPILIFSKLFCVVSLFIVLNACVSNNTDMLIGQKAVYPFYNDHSGQALAEYLYTAQTIDASHGNRAHKTGAVHTVYIAAASADNRQLVQQMKVLAKLDAQDLQLVYVQALADAIDAHGYYTLPQTALEILQDRDFRFLIVSPQNRIILASDKVLLLSQLEQLFARPFDY